MVREVFEEAIEIADKYGILMKLPHYVGEDSAEGRLHKDCFVSWRDFFLGSDGYVRPCMSTPEKFFKYDVARGFFDMWNDEKFQKYCRIVNDEVMMDGACKRCYQYSHCNWNNKSSFIQIGEEFSPEWEKA